jgi:microcystin-dependent protein
MKNRRTIRWRDRRALLTGAAAVSAGVAAGGLGREKHVYAATEPFIGEIAMVAFNFAPRGWALCDGQLLQISQNTALFSLLGTTFGGDGKMTFALPDFRGRVPLHAGAGAGLTPRSLGEAGGVEAVALSGGEMPVHRHSVGIAGRAAAFDVRRVREGVVADRVLNHRETTTAAGGGRAHENMPPFLGLNFIIALQGIYPVRD